MESKSSRGNDKLLFGIILGVLAFWLFAQTTLNINVDMAKELGMGTGMMNIAVSITSLFSGIFIVVARGLADRVGRLKLIDIGSKSWGISLDGKGKRNIQETGESVQ